MKGIRYVHCQEIISMYLRQCKYVLPRVYHKLIERVMLTILEKIREKEQEL